MSAACMEDSLGYAFKGGDMSTERYLMPRTQGVAEIPEACWVP